MFGFFENVKSPPHPGQNFRSYINCEWSLTDLHKLHKATRNATKWFLIKDKIKTRCLTLVMALSPQLLHILLLMIQSYTIYVRTCMYISRTRTHGHPFQLMGMSSTLYYFGTILSKYASVIFMLSTSMQPQPSRTCISQMTCFHIPRRPLPQSKGTCACFHSVRGFLLIRGCMH